MPGAGTCQPRRGSDAGHRGYQTSAQGPGAHNTYWTRTVWQERDLMNAFVGSEPHLSTMNRIDDWCDEATFVGWEQASADLPDWQDSYGRLIANGQAASLTHASDAHHTRDFPAPIVPA
jgi:hypothetical protein